jgi:hypothetical protein
MVIVCTHARPPCLRSMICKAYLPGSFQQDCLQTIVLSMTNHSEDEVPFPAPDPDRSKHQRASGPTLDENSITAMAGIGIGAIATEIGLTKDTLRVWERRYGFPRPLRTAGGERLYPQEQVTKLRMVKRNDFNPVCRSIPSSPNSPICAWRLRHPWRYGRAAPAPRSDASCLQA